MWPLHELVDAFGYDLLPLIKGICLKVETSNYVVWLTLADVCTVNACQFIVTVDIRRILATSAEG